MINHQFYKTLLVNLLEEKVAPMKVMLLSELTELASDPVLWKRRFRMLKHLNEWHAQIIYKIYQFETNDVNDYASSSFLETVELELKEITSKNA